jgi:hypothetical protein
MESEWIAAGVTIVVVGVIAVFAFWRKQQRSRPAANAEVFRSLLNVPGQAAPARADPETEELRQNLRVKLLYQEDKIDQAVAHERERNPGGTSADLMRAAIQRWERDNR